MSKRKHYANDFKVQAVKLALEIGQSKAKFTGKHDLWLDLVQVLNLPLGY